MPNKTECLKGYVTVTGIKKRCRKVSRELINIGIYPLGTTFAEIQDKAVKAASDAMKTIERGSIHLDHIGLEKSNGFNVETWQMFDPRHKKVDLLTLA